MNHKISLSEALDLLGDEYPKAKKEVYSVCSILFFFPSVACFILFLITTVFANFTGSAILIFSIIVIQVLFFLFLKVKTTSLDDYKVFFKGINK